MGAGIISLAVANEIPVDVIGGKASGLAALMADGFPVPDGWIVPASAYAAALRDSGLSLGGGSAEAFGAMAMDREVSEAIRETANGLLASARSIAVRSSGTLEDSASASFAGLLETFTDITSPEAAVEAVRRCWASVFSHRVAVYLREKGYDPACLEVAVVLQRQLEVERSGLAFSRDPVNRYASGIVIEAIAGFGEDLVSGEVTPERYVLSTETGRVTVTRPARNERPAVRNGPRGVVLGTPEERRLTDAEVALLANWAQRAEDLFSVPQDMEWAYADGGFWFLQSRPLVFAQRDERLFPQIAEHTVLASGTGVSPSVGAGRVLVFAEDDRVSDAGQGTVAVLPRLTNDLAIHLRHASGVVADEGGATSHGANILRELEVPCVIGAGTATVDLSDGQAVTVDGFRGLVFEGDLSLKPVEDEGVPDTRTQVFVSVLVPDRVAVVASRADGVSSLRNDYFLLDAGIHPNRLIEEGHAGALSDAVYRGLVRCSELFAGRPVWYKMMDAPTDEFRRLAGGDDEPRERNPLLGWRGIGRELSDEAMLDVELGAVARAVGSGCDNIGVKLPFIRFVAEFKKAREALRARGLVPHEDVSLGISVEIPAVAMRLGEFLDEGVDFVSVGLSDLTMCTLALDRESRHVSGLFDPAHPAVLELLSRIAEECRRYGVFSLVAGESARDERVLSFLVDAGFDAVAVSPSYFGDLKRRLAAIERGA